MDSLPVLNPCTTAFPHCHRVNDRHSGLNPAAVLRTFHPRNLFEVAATVARARRIGVPVSVCGGRHAMGGQQFGEAGWLVDLSGCNRVLQFDAQRGLIEVEAGMQWPELLQALDRLQPEAAGGTAAPWTFRQKQTGADRLSIGGALSANIHGRGLDFAPFVSDIESFTLVTVDGRLRRVSRSEQPDLFRLAIGGYGLFGIVGSVTLRLVRRCRLQRDVEIVEADALMEAFDARRAQGYLHVDHAPDGIEAAAAAFRRLIDRAIERGGSYYLTYHRFATRAQVEACYPQFRAFLRLKEAWDPDGVFQSDWYRHCRALFGRAADSACTVERRIATAAGSHAR